MTRSEKKRIRLHIVNPEPDHNGVRQLVISLYHAQRQINRGLAVRVNDRNEPDPSGEWLFFIRGAKVADGGKVDLPALLGRITRSAKLPIRDLPMCMSNLTGTSLWPVIPNYTEGRPFKDFLVTVARAKASRNSSSGSEGKQ